MREWLTRLRDWLRRDRLDRELTEELRFHREQLERDARDEGTPAEAAGYLAHRRLGNQTVIREEARELAIRVFRACRLSGLARVDFFLEKGTGRLLVNEVNTVPGFTAISMYPKLWEASGLPLTALLDELVRLALARHARRANLQTQPPAELA